MGKFTTLDVILEDEEFNCFAVLSKCVPEEQWANISERKGQSALRDYHGYIL